MREIIARALWLSAASCRDKEALWLTMKDFDRESYFRGADAVLDALMEPTPVMIAFVLPRVGNPTEQDREIAAEAVRHLDDGLKPVALTFAAELVLDFRAMISAAKNEGQR
jgi:hypothetical protein